MSCLLRLRPDRSPARPLDVVGVRSTAEAIRKASNPTVPNRLWIADLTAVRTGEGWLHLAAVLDCYSRSCVGWWVGPRRTRGLLTHAVQMAVARRWPAAALGHDRAGGEVALALGERCRTAGVALPRRAAPSTFDRAVAESFFAALRRELVEHRDWPTRTEADFALSQWIDLYNPRTLHNLGPVPARELIEEASAESSESRDRA